METPPLFGIVCLYLHVANKKQQQILYHVMTFCATGTFQEKKKKKKKKKKKTTRENIKD